MQFLTFYFGGGTELLEPSLSIFFYIYIYDYTILFNNPGKNVSQL